MQKLVDMIDLIRFKTLTNELNDIAKRAADCGFITKDWNDEAKRAVFITRELSDLIREHEIDELLMVRENAKTG